MTAAPEGRLAAALADRYRIERELGAGGMATVYLAEDLKHRRHVAVKVLKPELAAVLGADRFVQEITTTAALQHPHILPLYDSGEADGFLFYVMPFIDGETLRAKLDRETQLGVEEAVRIATNVADALDHAHRHGVIHRDIKPENILLHEGRPMVADFGIALAVSAAAGGRMTETGLSLGTPHYMSPEQATAEKEISARSDVYSLATVLYEMLAGDPPHTGSSAQQIIMKIIVEAPRPVTELRKSVPPHVAAAVAQALEKLPADRFESARAFREALANAAFAGRGGGWDVAGTRRAPDRRRSRRYGALAMAALLLILGVAAGVAWSGLSDSAPSPAVTRFEIALGEPESGRERVQLRMSHDGRRVMMSNEIGPGLRGVLVRDLASTEVVHLEGTDGASDADFSPDGEWIVFNRDLRVVKVPARGGPALTIAEDANYGAAWLSGGTVVYTRASDYGLSSVPAAGGASRVLSTPDTTRGEWGHWGHEALPGGHAILFTVYTAPFANSRIDAIDVTTGERTVVMANAVNPRYSPTGHLLFARDGTIYAVEFDPQALVASGSPVPVLEGVLWSATGGSVAFDVADDGTMAFIRASAWTARTRLVWVDRAGTESEAVPDSGVYSDPRISPDGRQVALTIRRPDGFPALSVFDLTRGLLTMTERSPGAVFGPVWTADGMSLLSAWEVRAYEIFSVRVDGSAPPAAVLETPYDKIPSSLAAASGLLAYDEVVDGLNRLMLAPLDGSGPPRQVEALRAASHASLSPDGRWVAFTAETRGRPEVFVRATDGSGGRVQVSLAGGTEPRWTRAGREIVFREGEAMLAVAAEPATGSFARPELLFRGPYIRASSASAHQYDVTASGDRFLMVRPVERAHALPVVVTLGWSTVLRSLLKP